MNEMRVEIEADGPTAPLSEIVAARLREALRVDELESHFRVSRQTLSAVADLVEAAGGGFYQGMNLSRFALALRRLAESLRVEPREGMEER